MSVVLVCFSAAPKISEEAVKKEEELDKYLETRVEGQHSEHTQTNLQTMTVWFWVFMHLKNNLLSLQAQKNNFL